MGLNFPFSFSKQGLNYMHIVYLYFSTHLIKPRHPLTRKLHQEGKQRSLTK